MEQARQAPLSEADTNFPAECRYVLEQLGRMYGYEAVVQERKLTAVEWLQFHQQHSGPVMEELHHRLEAQFVQKKTEPNSGLGKVSYLLRHRRALTAFLREKNAPLDNTVSNEP